MDLPADVAFQLVHSGRFRIKIIQANYINEKEWATILTECREELPYMKQIAVPAFFNGFCDASYLPRTALQESWLNLFTIDYIIIGNLLNIYVVRTL